MSAPDIDRTLIMFGGTGGNWDRSAHVALKEIQDEIIGELERLGTPTAAIHYIVTELLDHGLRRGQIAQRVLWSKRRRERIAEQNRQKPQLKQRAVEAYDAVCAYCERKGTPEVDPDGGPWQLDRIFPGAFGGEYCAKNVALACKQCNAKKGMNVTFCPPPSLEQQEAA